MYSFVTIRYQFEHHQLNFHITIKSHLIFLQQISRKIKANLEIYCRHRWENNIQALKYAKQFILPFQGKYLQL